MPFVRTVLGDIEPAELGVTYAHEHLVIDGGRPVELYPDFLLADVDRMAAEVERGGRARPARPRSTRCPPTAGRNADEARRAVAARAGSTSSPRPDSTTSGSTARATGAARSVEDELADLFVADVEEGIDEHDYSGPDRPPDGASGPGVIKIAGSDGGPSARDRADLRARPPTPTAGPASRSSPTARPGPGRSSRSALLTDARRARPSTISLSHVDKVVDRGYHRELLATGAFAEYDQAFRWGDRAERHARAARGGGRRRPAAARSCSGWTPRARATTRPTAGRPA